MVSSLLEMMKLVQNLCNFEAPGDLGKASRTSRGLLGAFLEAGAKSGVLKGTKSFNFGSPFGASLMLWRHPQSFMEFSGLEKCHL